MYVNPWDEAATETLRQMADAGHTAREIALALGEGVTRNAVIGKCQRMGIWLKGKQRFAKSEEPEQEQEPEAAPEPVAPKVRTPRPPKPPRVIVDAPAPKLSGTQVLFMDAGFGMCRFPMGGRGINMVFCGGASGVDSWCADHRKLVYQPRFPVRRDGEEIELSTKPDGLLPDAPGGATQPA